MANPLPPYLESYRKRIEANLAEVRDNLAPLMAGEMHMGEKVGNGPWQDTTVRWIAQYKRTIGTYETILAAIKKRDLG
jgi:hypothetical protein